MGSDCAVAIVCVILAASVPSSAQGQAGDATKSFVSTDRLQTSTSDLNKSDDIRSFTSEALFAQSRSRLNRTLTQDELRGIVRTKHEFETDNQFVFRLDDQYSAGTYIKYNSTDSAQITQFYDPGTFNRVTVSEIGASLQRAFIGSTATGLLRGKLSRQRRTGLIEFLSDASDDVDQLEINAATAGTFATESIGILGTYVRQNITLNIPNPYERNRNIVGLLATVGAEFNRLYDNGRLISSSEQLFDRRFDAAGLKLYGGQVRDTERFGTTDITKTDTFLATSLVAWFAETRSKFDLIVDVTQFKSDNSADASQNSSQRSAGFTASYRPDRSLDILVPFRRAITGTGLASFENWRTGAEVRWRPSGSPQNAMLPRFSCALRYDYVRFTLLHKNVSTGGIVITIGLP